MPLLFGFRTKGLCIEVGKRKRWFGFVSGFFCLWFLNLFCLLTSSRVSFCRLHSVAWSMVRADSLALLSARTAFLAGQPLSLG